MKYIINSVIILFSLGIITLVAMRSVGMGTYLALILLEYILILVLKPGFRKATMQYFIKKGSFGEEEGSYGKIHLETFHKDVETLDTQSFESFICDLYKVLGYKVKPIEENRELGGDLLMKKDKDVLVVRVVHCESIDSSVGNNVVQEVCAAKSVFKANRSMVVCNGDFSESAYKQASYTKTDMINGHQLLNLFRKVIQDNAEAHSKGSCEKVEDHMNEKITKADCLCEQYEHIITETPLTEVTLDGVHDKETDKEINNEKKSDASNS